MNHPTVKALLLLITIALWGILLRLTWSPQPVQAQSTPAPAAPTQVQYQFSFIRDTTDVKAALNALKDSLNQDAAKGWRAKSVAIESDTGLMVVLQEK